MGDGGGRGKIDPAAAALRNAAALMLASFKAVSFSLTSVAAADAGARKVCQLGALPGEVGRGGREAVGWGLAKHLKALLA